MMQNGLVAKYYDNMAAAWGDSTAAANSGYPVQAGVCESPAAQRPEKKDVKGVPVAGLSD
jgi:hypothetical protein